MKKVYLFLLLSSLIVTMLSCKSSSDNDMDNDTDNSVQYTKEFAYLPAYNEDMDLVDFKEGEPGEVDIATYVVKDTSPDEFLPNYEELLVEDGWKNTFDNKPVSINMEKEDHVAIIITPPIKEDEDLVVMIYSK